jgi:hypothetical protein
MISIAGVEFITQENILSWPTSYFMKTYGKTWLERSGFSVSGPAFLDAIYRSVPVLAVVIAACIFLRWRRYDRRSVLLRALIVFTLALYFIKHNYFILAFKQNAMQLLTTLFFPRDMVLYTVVAAIVAWGYFLWKRAGARTLAVPLTLTFAGLVAFRILLRMGWRDYAIYYNGPAVLSFLLLVCLIIPRSNRSRRFVFLAELALCLGCLAPVWIQTRAIETEGAKFVPLNTPRGEVRVPQQLAKSYAAAIQFMKAKASSGQSVLSLPEDTSLYFLSGTYCPTRVYFFIPGAVAPGRMMSETINQIENKPVSYLIWSNRTFSEYGAKVFGKDFDQELGAYLESHYRPVGPLIPNADKDAKWTAVVWERKQEGQPQ